jgi:hypothetical protein
VTSVQFAFWWITQLPEANEAVSSRFVRIWAPSEDRERAAQGIIDLIGVGLSVGFRQESMQHVIVRVSRHEDRQRTNGADRFGNGYREFQPRSQPTLGKMPQRADRDPALIDLFDKGMFSFNKICNE